MNVRNVRLVGVMLATTVLAGVLACGSLSRYTFRASYHHPLKPEAPLEPGKSYVYGRFQLLEHEGMNNLAVEMISNETPPRRVHIPMREEDPVFAVPVDPGTYAIPYILLAAKAAIGVLVKGEYKRIDIREKPCSAWFQVGEEELIYVGDYVARVQSGYSSSVAILDHLVYDFNGTTQEMMRRYPRFRQQTPRGAWPNEIVHAWIRLGR